MSIFFFFFFLGKILQLFLITNIFMLQPSELNTYYDIEAVFKCLKDEYGIKQEDVILYGQSVGSGPTLHLASRLDRLRAVVLHSAILSGIRVLYPVKMTLWFDIFKVIFTSIHFYLFFFFLSILVGFLPRSQLLFLFARILTR